MFPRWIRKITLILGIILLILGGKLYLRRGTVETPYCVRFFDSGWGNSFHLIDGHSGQSIPVDSRPDPILQALRKTDGIPFYEVGRSPDRRYIAYVQATGHSKIYLEALYGLFLRPAVGGIPRLMQDNIEYMIRYDGIAEVAFAWSPDSQWFIYSPDSDAYTEPINAFPSVISRADGSEPRIINVQGEFRRWLNKQYAIFTGANSLSFVSPASGTVISFETPPMASPTYPIPGVHEGNIDTLWESPKGNWIAYLGHRYAREGDYAPGVQWLVLASPEEKRSVTFEVRGQIGPSLKWSPDGRFVVLHTYATDGSRLDVIGINGTIYSSIIKDQQLIGYHNWLYQWSIDGKWLFFPDPIPSSIVPTANIVGFNVDTGKRKTFANNAINAQIAPNGVSMAFNIFEHNDKAGAWLLSLITEESYLLTDNLGRESIMNMRFYPSPDGRAVLFFSPNTYKIYLWTIGMKTPVQFDLNLDITTPSWSPDGTRIAFHAFDQLKEKLMLLTPGGTVVQQYPWPSAGGRFDWIACDQGFRPLE